jgi:hypothetical protein
MSSPYSSTGVENELTSDKTTFGGQLEPTLPRIPFRLLKYFILVSCKLTLNDFAETMYIPRYFEFLNNCNRFLDY